MRKFIIALAAIAMGALGLHAEIKITPNTFRDVNDADQLTGGQSMGNANMLTKSMDWPVDADGNDNVSVLFVKFRNVPVTEYTNFKVSNADTPSPDAPMTTPMINGEAVLQVFVPSGNPMDLDFVHDSYGRTRLSGKNLQPHHAYIVEIENDKLVDITINSDPQGATVYFDKARKERTPLTINNVTLGKHNISLVAADHSIAADVPDSIIDITDTKLNFVFPMRRTTQMTFRTEPSGGFIRIRKDNMVLASGNSPLTYKIPYGAYTIEGTHNNETVEQTVNIGEGMANSYTIRVIPSRNISIRAIQNNNPYNGANINVDGVMAGTTPAIIPMTYGHHQVEISTYGVRKSKNIHVTRESDAEYTFRLPNRQASRHNPFDIDYNRREWGMDFGYVNRHFAAKDQSGVTQRYSTHGSEPGMSENGIQMGVVYNPYFGAGQGLVTGLYWQMFWEDIKGADGEPTWFDHQLYIPLQYQFRLPLGEDFAIFINGGFAVSIGVSSKAEYGENQGSVDLGYGDDEGYDMPDRFQYMIPFGGGLQWKSLKVYGEYHLGLNDNKAMKNSFQYPDQIKSMKMRSWQVNLALMF